MTRFTRLGKSTHSRVAENSTPWTTLKNTPIKDKDSRKKSRIDKRSKFNQKRIIRDEISANFTELGPKISKETTANFTELGPKISKETTNDVQEDIKKKSLSNTRGFGESKTTKVFGLFWVPVEDAKRFKALSKKLKEQGLSRKEILAGLQQERRKAEKKAKRIRDKVCFACRQFGHILSDCPTNGKNLESASGEICFKCGSAEHSSRNCKRKDDTFKFATCFICSQPGHISRQCNNNKNGIYPSGGECNICGLLTHLAKDCPNSFENSREKGTKTIRISSEESSLPIVSNPYSSTEYEPFGNEEIKKAPALKKKRKVKF